jgi:hypothetical protein
LWLYDTKVDDMYLQFVCENGFSGLLHFLHHEMYIVYDAQRTSDRLIHLE